MSSPALIRFVGLFLPLTGVGLAWLVAQPRRRQLVGALLASAWCVPTLVLLHSVALELGWWGFEAEGGIFLGIPADLFLGWVILWGILPAIAFAATPLGLIVLGLLGIDLLLMPLAQPVLQLGSYWYFGEVLGLALVVVPAQLLARWTARGTRLGARVALIAIAFVGLAFGTLTAFILDLTGGSWVLLTQRPLWLTSIHLQLLAIPAVMGLSAVQEFATRGLGTPIPFDPPQRIVTSGVYAYLANPMQASTAIVLVGWGLLVGSPWLVLAGPMSVIFSVGIAAWSEGGDLSQRFGAQWTAYRAEVYNWRPRLRPWHPSLNGAEPDRLYVAESCIPCSEVGRWFAARRPVGLELHAAERHPTRDLSRLTYESGDGTFTVEGTAALARGLEHIHLGWALIGSALRLPIIDRFVQLLVDAVGGGPRQATRYPSNVLRSSEQLPD